MKNLLVTVLFAVAAAPALACLPHPGQPIRLRNDLVRDIANEYYADLTAADVTLENYTHNYEWKFTDSGFMCHDTDHMSGDIRLVYKDVMEGGTCSVKVRVSRSVGPEVKDGPTVVKTDVQVLEAKSCQRSTPVED